MKAEEKFIIADGCAVRVSDTRKGDCTVVLLHGYLESLDVWDDFTELIAGSVRVVSIDLPGHGVSEIKGDTHSMAFLSDVVHGAMQTLGIERAIIAGHSMGGYAALELLHRHPEVVAGIVLMHSEPIADSEQKRENRLREIALIQGGKKELIARRFPHVGFAPQNRERMAHKIRELAEQIVLTEDEGIMASLRGIRERADLSDMLRESAVPQMLILGRHDEYIPSQAAAYAVEKAPLAEVVWLENSGHQGFMEEPQIVAAALLGFVRRVCG